MIKGKRWCYLGVGTVLLIFCGLIYGWSLFNVPFSEVYPDWSFSQLSMTFTISMTFFGIGGFTAGNLLRKIKPKTIIRISAVLLLLGFVGVSKMNPANSSSGLMMLYLFYGVFGGTGIGFSYNCVISVVNKWFPDKQGLASGIMMMGFGLGALILGGAATKVIASAGLLRAFFILGFLLFTVLMVGSFYIKAPEQLNPESDKTLEAEGKNTVEMLKTTSFKVFILWLILVNSAGLMVINSAASIAVSFGVPAIAGMIVSVFNGAGRVLIGNIFDKAGRKNTMIINVAILIASGILLFAGAKTSMTILLLAGLLCMGITYGGNATICSAFINKQYGSKYFSVNFSIGGFSLIPAAIAGPMISSKLVEQAGGTYDSTFLAIIICSVGALALWIWLNKACDKERT